MRGSPLKLYGPLLAFVLVQAMFVAFAPSRPPQQVEIGTAPTLDEEQPSLPTATAAPTPASSPFVTAPGEAVTPPGGGTTGTGTSGTTGGTGGTTGDATTGGTTGGTSGGATGGATTGATTGEPTQPAGDTSHCSAEGRQTELLYYAPPCVPKWEGDNGGSTYQGVAADTVKVVVFQEQRNEAVSRILSAEGLRETRENENVFTQVAEDFLNEHYEFYGRKLDLIPHPAPNCPETPPNVDGCLNEMRTMLDTVRPFAVIWQVPTYGEVFDFLASEGVISLGGWHHDDSFFSGRRPFRYDVFMDGTRTAEFIGEYYCKKMANQNATHTGAIIHRTIGARGQVPRRLGILTPDTEATMRSAQRLVDIVSDCDAQEPVLVGYDQDISRSTQQASANTQSFIAEKVTTVVCMCDPITPVFRTNNQTRNEYFPENLLAGSGLIDFDKLGRLYDKSQWQHAFGPSHLQIQPPHSESDATIVWQDQGRSGNACVSCNLPWSYYQLMGAMLQVAGPDLNPLSVERGMLNLPDRGGWAESGGDPTKVLNRMGTGDYTVLSDVKIVYWDEQASSTVDGRPGAYVALDGGRRYTHGELDTELRVPVGTT
ncbi:MAG: hypothetical protein KY469_18425 [Actinobacteria bacterium]|nr:hypothetical protein [Actinomycetota bacterium]